MPFSYVIIFAPIGRRLTSSGVNELPHPFKNPLVYVSNSSILQETRLKLISSSYAVLAPVRIASYKLKNTEEILDLITNYLKQHIHEQITLEQICHDNSAGLGYQSVQYFSRQFKNLTGMTPTEYSSSIKALAENSFPE